MPSIYDELYQESNYYGKAVPDVLNYFKDLPKSLTILDVGCGQGRYTIPMAEMGFKVTALDNSDVALKQLRKRITGSKPEIKILHTDAYLFREYGKYDLVFLNLFFHFQDFNLKDEQRLIQTILSSIASGSNALFVIHESTKSKSELLNSIRSIVGIKVNHQKSLVYKNITPPPKPPGNTSYFIVIAEKELR